MLPREKFEILAQNEQASGLHTRHFEWEGLPSVFLTSLVIEAQWTIQDSSKEHVAAIILLSLPIGSGVLNMWRIDG
jgi:hypothetical protein